MSVAFDAHIQYFAYHNVDGDEFGVGMIGTKEDWIERVNRWGEEDGAQSDFTVEDWEDLEIINARGILFAEVEPIDNDLVVSWEEGGDNSIRITAKNQYVWENNPKNISSIPRWISRLKNTIRA